MIVVSVCIGSACHKRGSYDILTRLKELCCERGVADQVSVVPVFCMGECKGGVSVKVDDKLFLGMTAEGVPALFENHVLPKLGEKEDSHGNFAV